MSNIAVSAGAVVDSLGVNTHLDFKNSAYQNLSAVDAAINYLGVHNLRDSAQNVSDLTVWAQIAHATGAKFDDYMGEGSPALDMADLGLVSQLASQGVLNSVEGGNENDDPYAIGQGNSIAWTAAFQTQVYATGHALGLPVINMSFGSGWTWLNNWHGDYDKVGDLSAIADYGNAHTYPGAGTVASAIQNLNDNARLAASSRPVITTEIGWDTASVSQHDAARFTLEAVLDATKAGDVKTYFYSLFDDTPGGKFGLMNADGTPRPAGTALHDLTTILADPGAPRTGSLDYVLSGKTANNSTLLMEKSSGVFDLAIWNESDASHNLVLTLGSAAQSINVYDPLTGTSPVASASGTTITITLPDHPLIVEIVPTGQSASVSSSAAASSTASSEFDASFYLQHNADVAAAGIDPMQHFLQFGWKEGRAPDAIFDVNYYLQHNPDVAATGLDPLIHYEAFGWKEGRNPSASFSSSAYLAANPDVKLAGMDPLQHYLQYGLAEHRPLGL